MKKFNLKEYIGNNPLLKEEITLDFYDEDAVTLIDGSGEYDGDIEEDGMVSFSLVDDEEEFEDYNWEDILGSDHAFVKISKQIPTKVEASGDYVMITINIDDLKGISRLEENNPIKEDGQWDDEWSPSFDDLKNRAKQIKGFEDMGKYGFSVPYEHGEIEIEPLSISGEMSPFHEKKVKITWISPGNEDSQVSPLSTGYEAVDGAIRSSQDKTDWKRMAGLEEDEIPIKEYSWDDEDFDEEEEEVDDIYSEYTSRDGWNKNALEDVGLMELISEIERLAYEVRNARRGSYAKFGDTGEELKTYLEELGRSFTQISNNM